MRNSKKVATKVPENPNRKVNKKARGFGMGAVESLFGFKDVDVIKWNQHKDPLFKVKGKERTARMKQYR